MNYSDIRHESVVPDAQKFNEQVAEVACKIERYLAEHPDAADSLEGILKWWLPNQSHEEPAYVDKALERLVANGGVTKRRQPDGKVIYSSARKPAK